MAHELRYFALVAVLTPLYLQIVWGLKECKKIDRCRCSTDEGEINIWSLAGKGGDVPRFHMKGSSQSEYYWNPCDSWILEDKQSDKNLCKSDTAVCQSRVPVGTEQKWYYQIGRQSTTDYIFDSKQETCILTYKGEGEGSKSVVNIRLSCDKNTKEPTVTKVVSSDDQSTLIFETVLTHRCACPGVCVGLSTGSILLIVFFVIVFVYLVSGILFNKFHKGATGKELIPNYSFWSDFPSLVKDGFVFTYQKLRNLCGGSGSQKYDSL